MISASIKLSNLHYFEALQDLALANLPQIHNKPKLLQIPFYNFVCTIVDILTEFSKSVNLLEHSEKQVFNLNSYLVDYYFKKYEGNYVQIYRQFLSFLRSWKKYTQHHEEAKLFLSLLTEKRNNVDCVKLFLKFRKCILKSLNQKVLQELELTHQDTLTITHTLFSHNLQVKNYVTKKINELFISLKRKLINSAKVNGAVMCEFFMACCQRFSQLNIDKLFGQPKPQKKKILRHVTNTNQKQVVSYSPLKNKNQNSILNTQQSNKPADKYILSFSEQFASYYSPQTNELNIPEDKQIQPRNAQSKFMSNFQELQNEWKMNNNENEAPLNLVKDSLTFFKKKDQQIDKKLTNCRKFYFNHQQTHQKSNHSDIKQNVNYPEGWDNFIRTNAKTKKKLMEQKKPNFESKFL